MLHILPIALREIMHAQHDCIRNLEIVKYCCSARLPFKYWCSTRTTRFFIRKFFIRKWALKTLKSSENVKKSPASDAWAAILKNAWAL